MNEYMKKKGKKIKKKLANHSMLVDSLLRNEHYFLFINKSEQAIVPYENLQTFLTIGPKTGADIKNMRCFEVKEVNPTKIVEEVEKRTIVL